jgi:hypothetical protein
METKEVDLVPTGPPVRDFNGPIEITDRTPDGRGGHRVPEERHEWRSAPGVHVHALQEHLVEIRVVTTPTVMDTQDDFWKRVISLEKDLISSGGVRPDMKETESAGTMVTSEFGEALPDKPKCKGMSARASWHCFLVGLVTKRFRPLGRKSRRVELDLPNMTGTKDPVTLEWPTLCGLEKLSAVSTPVDVHEALNPSTVCPYCRAVEPGRRVEATPLKDLADRERASLDRLSGDLLEPIRDHLILFPVRCASTFKYIHLT